MQKYANGFLRMSVSYQCRTPGSSIMWPMQGLAAKQGIVWPRCTQPVQSQCNVQGRMKGRG